MSVVMIVALVALVVFHPDRHSLDDRLDASKSGPSALRKAAQSGKAACHREVGVAWRGAGGLMGWRRCGRRDSR